LATIALGVPILVLAAPAAGVLFGWLIGGLVSLVIRALPGSGHGHAATPTPRLSGNRAHWERVYLDDSPQSLSWFEPEPRGSLEIIDSLGLPPQEPIVDVGGGTSRLAAELLARGHTDLTVVDISNRALEKARQGLPDSGLVSWVQGDVRTHAFGRRFALWHDRAVFHFMVAPEDRGSYLDTLERSLAPGGHLVIATFGPEGPAHCSGLPVVRYSAEELAEALRDFAELRSQRYQEHQTPGGKVQQYLYAHFIVRRPAGRRAAAR
jgi:ubiquinone/menaquinone biosynthesis C-methylase UbiE